MVYTLSGGKIVSVSTEKIGERFARYRVVSGRAVELMRQSLERCGQIAPVVLCNLAGCLELVDGFKRLQAARSLSELSVLSARIIECDEQSAKAAIYVLNRAGGRIRDLEEAWIVRSLVREDGLSQQEVAQLLGRHKSWVSRRLALVERLCPEAQTDLQLGFLSTTAAREIQRLPRGTKGEVLDVVRRESLTTADSRLLVDAFLACAGRSQQEFVLKKPREAIAQQGAEAQSAYDPRLSPAANRSLRRVRLLLELLTRMDGWLRTQGRAEITERDLAILQGDLEKLARECRDVAESAGDFLNVRASR